jgi:hypothetical protein
VDWTVAHPSCESENVGVNALKQEKLGFNYQFLDGPDFRKLPWGYRYPVIP